MIPKGYNGITLGWVIFIDPKYKNDPDLIAHENVHVSQFNRYHVMFWWRYLTSKRWRKRLESEAYAAEVKLRYTPYEQKKELFKNAEILAKKYRLNISIEEAIIAIENYL